MKHDLPTISVASSLTISVFVIKQKVQAQNSRPQRVKKNGRHDC